MQLYHEYLESEYSSPNVRFQENKLKKWKVFSPYLRAKMQTRKVKKEGFYKKLEEKKMEKMAEVSAILQKPTIEELNKLHRRLIQTTGLAMQGMAVKKKVVVNWEEKLVDVFNHHEYKTSDIKNLYEMVKAERGEPTRYTHENIEIKEKGWIDENFSEEEITFMKVLNERKDND